MQRLLIVICTLLLVLLPGLVRAEGVTTVHQESVQVGPYTVNIGFSRWPLEADRSLDILFMPEGGIEGLRGTVTLVSPTGEEDRMPLARHPRMREVWGLDVIALPAEGPWSMIFRIDGPAGSGEGRLASLMLGERPGPAAAISWSIGLLPMLVAIIAFAIAWWRVRPQRRPDAWVWDRA
jgi:hypothetical protein